MGTIAAARAATDVIETGPVNAEDQVFSGNKTLYGRLALGESASTTASRALTLDATNSAGFGVYCDDAGAAISSATLVRAIRGRLLLNYTAGNREEEAAGIIGQLVSKQGTNRHNMCGVMGSYEVNTGLTVDGQNPATDTWAQAAVIGRVGCGNNITTINAYGRLAGFAAMSNTTSFSANNGVYAGFYAGKWIGTTNWGYGLYIEQDNVTTAGIYIGSGATRAIDSQGKVRIGTGDGGVGSTPIALTGTDPDFVLDVNGKITAAVASAAYAAAYSSLALTATQTNDVSTFANWSEMYVTSGTSVTLNGNCAAYWGNLEISGTVLSAGSSSTYWGAFVGTVIAGTGLNNRAMMGAFVADSLLTTGYTNTGVIAAFLAHVNDSHATKADWPYGLYCENCTCDIRLSNAGGAGIYSRASSPNGALTAPLGSICIVSSGTTTNDRIWINTNGTTGWTYLTAGA